MKISILLKNILLASLLLVSLNAEDTKINSECDDTYNMCTEKCSESENAQEGCFISCDDKYDKCLASTQEPTKDQE